MCALGIKYTLPKCTLYVIYVCISAIGIRTNSKIRTNQNKNKNLVVDSFVYCFVSGAGKRVLSSNNCTNCRLLVGGRRAMKRHQNFQNYSYLMLHLQVHVFVNSMQFRVILNSYNKTKIKTTTTWHNIIYKCISRKFWSNVQEMCASQNAYRHPASQSHTHTYTHISISWQRQQQQQQQLPHLHVQQMPQFMPIIFNQGYAIVNLT